MEGINNFCKIHSNVVYDIKADTPADVNYNKCY